MNNLKKLFALMFILSFGLSFSLKIQSQDAAKETKYRRSSLHLILMESDKFPKKDTVIKAYYNAPFPDKYYDHTIGEKSFDPKLYTLTAEDRAAGQKKKTLVGGLMKGLASDATGGVVDTSKKDTPLIINKYFKQNNVAKKLVAKWFNMKDDGSCDANLIFERGLFDASFLETKTAQASSVGMGLLKNIGFELIENTFVVISNFNFKANEPVAAALRDAAILKASEMKNPLAQSAAVKAAEAVYQKTKEGYSVWATTYLYKLVWNDSIATTFFNDFYTETPDPKKKEAFDKSNIFKMEFVGDQNATSLILFSLKEKRTEDKIIEIATNRAVDKAYAKLQKEYDVFKPKTPLFTGEPITAKIGMKEGLDGGEKFEVLEQVIDPKTGLAEYKKKGTIEVDKKLIWDNRFAAGEAPEDMVTEGDAGKSAIDRTTFTGPKGLYAGMLIRQLK